MSGFGVCRSSSLLMRPEDKQVASPDETRRASLQIFENHSLGLPAIYFNLIPTRVEPIHSFDLIRVISRVSPKTLVQSAKADVNVCGCVFTRFPIHAASASLDLIFIASLDVMEKFPQSRWNEKINHFKSQFHRAGDMFGENNNNIC